MKIEQSAGRELKRMGCLNFSRSCEQANELDGGRRGERWAAISNDRGEVGIKAASAGMGTNDNDDEDGVCEWRPAPILVRGRARGLRLEVGRLNDRGLLLQIVDIGEEEGDL